MQDFDKNNTTAIEKLYLQNPVFLVDYFRRVENILNKNPSINELIIDGFPIMHESEGSEINETLIAKHKQNITSFLAIIKKYKIPNVIIYLPQPATEQMRQRYPSPIERCLFIQTLLNSRFPHLKKCILYNIHSVKDVSALLEDFFLQNLQITEGNISHLSYLSNAPFVSADEDTSVEQEQHHEEIETLVSFREMVKRICKENFDRLAVCEKLRQVNFPIHIAQLNNQHELCQQLTRINWSDYSPDDLQNVLAISRFIPSRLISNLLNTAVTSYLATYARLQQATLERCQSDKNFYQQQTAPTNQLISWQWFETAADKKRKREEIDKVISLEEPPQKKSKTGL
jgi:hypothetical protein